MQPIAETTAPRRHFLSIADAVFLFAVAAIAPTMAASNLKDPGLGWHLRNIDAMVEAGNWLRQDPFSNTGMTWYTNQWVGDLALWLGWHWAGWNGIAAVGLVVLGLTYRCLFSAISDDGSPWPLAAAWTFAAMLGSSLGWGVRPNLVLPLFLFVTVRFCSRLHEGRCSRRAMLLLPALFTLWANTHGGFLGGLVTLGVAVAIETTLTLLAPAGKERNASRKRATILAMITAACALATLVNPYGWKLYPWVTGLVSSNLTILEEWRSPDFNWTTWVGAERYEVFLLALPALLAVSQWRPTPVAAGLSVLWLHQALQARRFVPPWVLITAPLLARASLDVPWLRDPFLRIPWSPDFLNLLSRKAAPASPWVAALFCVALLAGSRLAPPLDVHLDQEDAMTTLLNLNDGHTVIFHDANWGGYLTWQGWDRQPRFQTWIDDRFDVHGETRLKQYLTIRDAIPGWDEEVDRLGIDVIGLAANWPLAQRLASEPDWIPLLRNNDSVVYRRRTGAAPK